MTLRQVIRALEGSARIQPNVNMIVEHDVFRINESPRQRYGAFAWLEGSHRVGRDTTEWAFTLFWVDRLEADRSNEGLLRSEGVETLANIVRRMEDKHGATASIPVFRTFTERFVDECAGAYCEVTFTTPNASICVDGAVKPDGGDFNEDFNDDFYIYDGGDGNKADYNNDYNENFYIY